MAATIEERLNELGIVLGVAPAAVANYVPYVLTGNMLYVSGQIPFENGVVKYTGQLGAGVAIETGKSAARLCCINILTQAKAALGDLERIEQCVRLGGFVASTADFHDHPQVINGASDLMVEALSDKGHHCRAAVGCSSLPLNAAVEVEATFKIIE